MIKLFTYKNTKYSTFEQQYGLNPPPPFKYHLNFNCTPVLSDCDTPFRFITGNRTILLCSKKGGWGLLMFPFEEWGGRWNVIQRYGNENLLKSSKGGRYAYLPASGLDLETISHRKYYVQVVNNGVCRGLSYYGFILRPQWHDSAVFNGS